MLAPTPQLLGIEVILSELTVELPPLPNQLNPISFRKNWWTLVTIETFTLDGITLRAPPLFTTTDRLFHHGQLPPAHLNASVIKARFSNHR
jgi:hypothetical protein